MKHGDALEMNLETIIFKWKFISFSRLLPVVKVKKKFYSSEFKMYFAVGAVIFWVIGKLSWMLLEAAKHSKINVAIRKIP